MLIQCKSFAFLLLITLAAYYGLREHNHLRRRLGLLPVEPDVLYLTPEEPHLTPDLLYEEPYPTPDVPCRENADIYPGVFSFENVTTCTQSWWRKRGVWVPQRCALTRFEDLDVKNCFENMNQVWFGDSLTRGVFGDLGWPLYGLPKKTVYKNYTGWAKGAALQVEYDSYDFKMPRGHMRFYWSSHSAHPGLYPHPDAQRDLKTADLIWIGGGAWDMGNDARPVDVFYQNYLRRVKDIQSKAKPGAKVVLFPLYWYNIEVNPKMLQWNTPNKLTAYREALHMVAACLGTYVVDAKGVTKGAGNRTRDGIHYDHCIGGAVGDILVNAVCREPGLDLTPRLATCDFEAAYAKWQAVEELGLPPAMNTSRYDPE